MFSYKTDANVVRLSVLGGLLVKPGGALPRKRYHEKRIYWEVSPETDVSIRLWAPSHQ